MLFVDRLFFFRLSELSMWALIHSLCMPDKHSTSELSIPILPPINVYIKLTLLKYDYHYYL